MPQSPEPLFVVHASYRRHQEEPSRFVHREHILCAIVEARGAYVHGNLPVQIDSPRMSFLPAGCEEINGLQGRVEAWWVGFRWPGFEAKLCGPGQVQLRWGGREARFPVYKLLDPATLLLFVERYQALHAAQQRQDLAGALQARACFHDLFTAYLDLPAPEGADGLTGHRALTRFHALLEKHACSEVSLDALAERAGASADHLRDLFKQRFGQPPVVYRTALRMNKARTLLAGTALNVSEVAREVGYVDPLYFSRAFRKHYGLSPREMIRRYRLVPR